MSPTPNVLELVRREDAAIECKDKLILYIRKGSQSDDLDLHVYLLL